MAVDRGSGRRVVFGSPGAPAASVGEAVEASCTVPWLFAPVTIGGREYVDGGVWSPTNLDAAPAGRDTYVLCLNPTASITGSQTVLGVIRSVARSAVSIEAIALRRRGAAVQTVAPNLECAAAMGTNFMDREPPRPGAGRGVPAGAGAGRALRYGAADRLGARRPRRAPPRRRRSLRRRTAFDSARTYARPPASRMSVETPWPEPVTPPTSSTTEVSPSAS